MINYDNILDSIFSCQSTSKKAKFLEFGMENANLPILVFSFHHLTIMLTVLAWNRGEFPQQKNSNLFS